MTRLVVDNPATGEVAAEVELLRSEEVDGLVRRASAAQRDWCRTSLSERIALCERFNAEIERRTGEIAALITRQMGKPIGEARGEVETLLGRARGMMALAATALADVVLPEELGLRRFIGREPLGVVVDIAAWNYPLLIAGNVVVPAVLAGNAVLLKHARRTPLCADVFSDAFAAAGAPAGLVTAVHADHAVTAEILVHESVGGAFFTGSVRGGREVYAAVARQRFIDVGLELGGKDAAYVCADCDFDFTVANVVEGALYNAGQSCCAVERIYVERPLYARFVAAAVAAARAWQPGDPTDASVKLGAMAQPDAAGFLQHQIEAAVSQGARLLLGGNAATVGGRGRFFQATVVADATHEMEILREESFGPLVVIAPADDDESAVALMNDSPYGLTASVWTRDAERGEAIARSTEAGTVYLNRADYLDPELPWVGIKDSGKGCTLSHLGFQHLTRPKSYHLRLR